MTDTATDTATETPTGETDSAATAPEPTKDLLIEVDGKLVPNYDATMVAINVGEVVSGQVVRIDPEEVLVDVGYKSEGVIPANELSIRKSVDPYQEVELGEEVEALVLNKEDDEGRLLMSRKRAKFERSWQRVEAAQESGEAVKAIVIEVVKGGLILDLGVRGFLPASLVDVRRVANLDEYMDTEIECRVIEINRQRNNVVLSRRAVIEEERKEARQHILDQLHPGDIVVGNVSNIVDFGAFVDLNGIDGLIHISELSWSHVNHPSEVIAIGDEVEVKVLEIDRDRQRISLGLKQTQDDPWERLTKTYNVSDELEGKVTKIVPFGVFVEILEGVEGLVHISELSAQHVENPRQVVTEDDRLRVKVIEIDDDRRRLSLSAKQVEGQELAVRELLPEEKAEFADADTTGYEDLADPNFVPPAPAAEAPAEAGAESEEAAAPEATEAAAPEAEAAAETAVEAEVAAAEAVVEAEEAVAAAEDVAEAEPEAAAEAEADAAEAVAEAEEAVAEAEDKAEAAADAETPADEPEQTA